MGKCHYCECDEQSHDGRCPKVVGGNSALSDWHRGWNHGFKGSFCLHPDAPCYSLGYREGKFARDESEKRIHLTLGPR